MLIKSNIDNNRKKSHLLPLGGYRIDRYHDRLVYILLLQVLDLLCLHIYCA